MNYLPALYLLVFPLFLGWCDIATNSEDDYSSVTMDEICQNKITNYVDSIIYLETKVYWGNGQRIFEPLSDSLYASLLKLNFENGDNYISDDRRKDQHRGDLFVLSQHIYKNWDGLVEKYYFRNLLLSNNIKTYIFKGRIHFRDWLHITDDHLQDSVFINQSNDVVYWSQTFEFQVDEIISVY